MPNQQLVRHTATVLRRWREATNICASMKKFHCYDIDNSVVLIRHHWLDRQAALWNILWKCVNSMKMCGLQQDLVTWKICQEASADMSWEVNKSHSNQIALNIFGSTRTDFALNEQWRLNTSVHRAKVIYIFHWSSLQLPTILMVSILDWITVCIADVCISDKTINFSVKPLNK